MKSQQTTLSLVFGLSSLSTLNLKCVQTADFVLFDFATIYISCMLLLLIALFITTYLH